MACASVHGVVLTDHGPCRQGPMSDCQRAAEIRCMVMYLHPMPRMLIFWARCRHHRCWPKGAQVSHATATRLAVIADCRQGTAWMQGHTLTASLHMIAYPAGILPSYLPCCNTSQLQSKNTASEAGKRMQREGFPMVQRDAAGDEFSLAPTRMSLPQTGKKKG